MSITLVLLMVSFIFVTFPVADIIIGVFESSVIVDNKIDAGSVVLLFDDDTKKQLVDIYNNEQEVEFSLCLKGWREIDGKPTYHITSLYKPKTYLQTFNHVSFESCSSDTLVMLHSHPYKRCAASNTDLQTLKKSQLENDDLVMVVMCEPGRFSVYS